MEGRRSKSLATLIATGKRDEGPGHSRLSLREAKLSDTDTSGSEDAISAKSIPSLLSPLSVPSVALDGNSDKVGEGLYWTNGSRPIDISTTATPVQWAFSPSSSSASYSSQLSSPIHMYHGSRSQTSGQTSGPDVGAGNGDILEDEEFGEDTEHIDFAALKGHLGTFRPASDVDTSDPRKGKFVFYSMQTGLQRHHVLADMCRSPGTAKPVRNLSEVMRSGPFWLDICDPTSAELKALSEIFKMHPLTLEGLESEGEEIREKCDVFEKYYFVCIKAFEADIRSDQYMLPINLYMLVSPSCVITIHRDSLEFSHTIAKRMRLLTARTGLATDWIVYTILEDVLEMFVPSVRAVETEIDTIDDLVAHPVAASSGTSRPSQTELLGRIATARKRVTQLIRLMSAKSELLRVIAKRCVMRFTEDAHLYLRDLQDHTAMVDQTLHHYDESLNRSHANYLAHINIEISETSNHMSDVMKKLTAAATVTLPWSMITGLMGMNIFVPGGKSYFTESWVPWLCLFILMSTLSIIIYFVGRRRDWF